MNPSLKEKLRKLKEVEFVTYMPRFLKLAKDYCLKIQKELGIAHEVEIVSVPKLSQLKKDRSTTKLYFSAKIFQLSTR